jgi:SAM-dependent methyltransferase
MIEPETHQPGAKAHTAFPDKHALERASGGTVRQMKYLKRNPLRRYFITAFLATIARWVADSHARAVGDLGTGEGFVARHVRSLSGEWVIRVALDIEPGVLRVARYLNPALPVTVADVQRCPLRNACLDLVLCNEVLEHVSSPIDLLSELCRIAPLQIVSIPHEPLYRWANLAAGANWARQGDDPDHVNHWTPKQFRDFLSQRTCVIALKTSFPWTLALCRSA